jgi:hypothetical protein
MLHARAFGRLAFATALACLALAASAGVLASRKC